MVINDLSTQFVDKVDRSLKHIVFFVICHFIEKMLDRCNDFESTFPAAAHG